MIYKYILNKMKKKFSFVVYDEKKENILEKYDLEPKRYIVYNIRVNT